ncbi:MULTISPECIES: hypothetical protein [unclassified Methanosarcina]|uniref:hypothetical protein n=1 Tax=unclassified Methanosarcina TaxID=2644672 RepID=UPI000621216D|nr:MULTISPECIES: hypothetical protein [unclassified Methanosarcina]KKG16577.1 hypothetical protein EO94_07400 [Methanosarcina sp. 2.H.T.1A.3]KKG20168.1 hypothetical protein EO97_09550 [Methanosarcina sp. 2.H.T.1A.15]KKG25611.1 hypothetical protein EO96_18900 [Methanosarcina sp. 2.H.T.1A.8]
MSDDLNEETNTSDNKKGNIDTKSEETNTLDSKKEKTNIYSPEYQNALATKTIKDAHKRFSEVIFPSTFKVIEDAHKRFSEVIFPSTFKVIEDAQKSLSEVYSPSMFKAIEDAQKSLSEVYSPSMFKAIEDAHIKLSNLISKELVFDNWVKTNVQLFDFVNKRLSFVDSVDSKIIPILQKHNWFITVSLEDDFILNFSRTIENPSGKLGKEIRQEFINYFSRNNFEKLASMIESWEENTLFKPRMKIFRDSYNLLKHSHNSYNPSNFLIPTLISQIDGILTDYLIQNEFTIIQKGKGLVWTDKMNKNNWRISNRNKIFKDIFDPNIIEYSLPNGSMSSAALGIGNNFILNTLFQTAYTKQKLENPFGLSRHKIMHGEYVKYGRKDHLIRTYLMLDFLFGLENVDYNELST